MKKIILWISILTMILGTAGVASATLINGGFEDNGGSFDGWSAPPTGVVLDLFPPIQSLWDPLPFGPPPTMDSMKTPIVDSVNTNPIFTPTEGSKFAALKTGEATTPVANTDGSIPGEDKPGLPDGDKYSGKFTDDGSGPTLSQTVVTMQAGYTLSGYAAFFTQEPQYVRDTLGNILYSFNDSAYLRISGGTVNETIWGSSTDSIIADVDGKDNHELYFNASDGTYVLDPDLDPLPDPGIDPAWAFFPMIYVGGWSNWFYWDWTAPLAGDYTLTLGIINEDFYDGAIGSQFVERVDSVAFLDNVVLTPEPATVLLLASGLGGLAGLRRRFKK